MSFWKPKKTPDSPENKAPIETNTRPMSSKPAQAEPLVTQPPVNAKKEDTASRSVTQSDVDEGRNPKYRSALGSGTIIQGKLSFDTPVSIDGQLSGEVFSSTVLLVGTSGRVDAKIEASRLIVYGTVKGDIRATDCIELHSGATLEGKIVTPSLVIHEQSVFNGQCEMGNVKEQILAMNLSSADSQTKGNQQPAKGNGEQKQAPALSDQPSVSM